MRRMICKQYIFFLTALLIPFKTFLLIPSSIYSVDTYTFERMWPVLKQPWYFDNVTAVAANQQGDFYALSRNICEFKADDLFVNVFGTSLMLYDQTKHPEGIAVDKQRYK